MVRIATWGCEIRVIRLSRVLDPALQTSKNEKSRVELTDEIHCYEVHGFQRWFEVFSFKLYCSSLVQLTRVAIPAVLKYIFFDSFPVIQPLDG